MKIIIAAGEHGLGVAGDYYRQFPLEPSPAGDLDLQDADIVKVDHMTFDRLMVELAKVGAGGTALVVCHAHEELGSMFTASGLLMPITDDAGLTAQDEAFKRMSQAIDARRKATKIRAMPATNDKEQKAKKNEWIGLVTDFGLGFPPDDATLSQLDKFFEKGLTTVAHIDLQLKGGLASLKRLLDHIEKVQSLNLDRVEFRACKIGKDVETLTHLKQLLGCKKLLAPTARTFYANRMFVNTLNQFDRLYITDHRVGNFRPPGPAGQSYKDPGDFVIDVIRQNPSTRTFWDVEYGFIPPENRRVSLGTTTIKLKSRIMAMIVEEVAPSRYRSTAAAWHEAAGHKADMEDARKFVNQYIMKDSKYTGGTIMISGFWTPGEELPWLLPHEPEYVDHITQV